MGQKYRILLGGSIFIVIILFIWQIPLEQDYNLKRLLLISPFFIIWFQIEKQSYESKNSLNKDLILFFSNLLKFLNTIIENRNEASIHQILFLKSKSKYWTYFGIQLYETLKNTKSTESTDTDQNEGFIGIFSMLGGKYTFQYFITLAQNYNQIKILNEKPSNFLLDLKSSNKDKIKFYQEIIDYIRSHGHRLEISTEIAQLYGLAAKSQVRKFLQRF